MLKQRGLTLIELMIALTIGMVVSLGLTMMFSATMKARNEVVRFGEEIENGQFASAFLSQELGLAGMWDALEVPSAMAASATPSALPNACATDVATLKSAIFWHLQGYDNNNGGLGCITDVRNNTDVVVVRRAATCAGTGCTANGPFFLASLCSPPVSGGTVGDTQELGSGTPADWYDVQLASSGLSLHNRDCKTLATSSIRRYVTRIFYISNNTDPNDGIPALKMVELTDAAFNTNSPTLIASGIEQMQIEYGLDTNNNGYPDSYTNTPGIADWWNVVGVKIHILARSLSSSPDYDETGKTYILGSTTYPDAGGDQLTGSYFRRRVFSNTVRVTNPSVTRGG